MSKKLLAALIAFSMVGAFGCTESEDDNNGGNGGGNGCTQGARQCKGTVPQMCIAGSWTDGTDCGAVGCNAATGMCNTNGGNNNPGGDNNNPGGNNNNPGGNNNNTGDTPVAGATCDPTTYEGGCSADLSKRYYCGDDGRLVEKACNNGSTCNVKGNNSSECVGGNSGEACTKDTYTPSCKADGSEGYYCGSQGTVVTKTCSNNDCYNDDGYIGCGTPNNNNNNNNSGEACTKDTYTPSCKDDGSEGYYCGSQGTVVTKTCSNNDCYNDDGYIGCGTPNNNNDNNNTDPNCTPTEEKEASCSDGMDNDCDGHIDADDYNCPATTPCTATSTDRCAGACSDDKTKGYYYGNKTINVVDCPDANCSVSETGYVQCGEAQPCTMADYTPSCTSETLGLRCSSDGIVKTYTCYDGKKCNVLMPEDYTDDISATDYPAGYIQCI